jgi:hypothetical protein
MKILMVDALVRTMVDTLARIMGHASASNTLRPDYLTAGIGLDACSRVSSESKGNSGKVRGCDRPALRGPGRTLPISGAPPPVPTHASGSRATR